MNCWGAVERGEGRVESKGISFTPTRDKSGRAFAPQDQKGDFQVSKRANLIRRQREDRKKGKRGIGNKKNHQGVWHTCTLYHVPISYSFK
jgi:hypothetical protein